MRFTIPHNTTKAEARQIIERKMSELESQYSHYTSDIDKQWTGDTLNFNVKARGFTGKGTLELTDTDVIIDGKLPLIAKPFEPRIKSMVEKEAEALFRPQSS